MRMMMTEVYRDRINDLKDRKQDIKAAIALAKNL